MVKVKSCKRRRNDGFLGFGGSKTNESNEPKKTMTERLNELKSSALSGVKSFKAGVSSGMKSVSSAAQKTANNAKILYFKNKISSLLEEAKKLKERQAYHYFDNLNETDNLDFKKIEDNFNTTLTQYSLKTSVDGARFRRTKKRSQKKRRSRK
jgi:hypothetical protein